jgi:hypothetical protein
MAKLFFEVSTAKTHKSKNHNRATFIYQKAEPCSSGSVRQKINIRPTQSTSPARDHFLRGHAG